MNGLFQTICRIGIFMICAQAVIHFRPQASYEKYLKLLVSAMVLIQLFLPVSRLLFHGDGEEIAEKSRAFLEGLEAEMSAAEGRAYEADALLEQMTLEEIRRRVEEEQAAREGAGPDSGGTSSGGTSNGRTDNGGTDRGGTSNGGADNGGTADDGADRTVQIERIRVEEIKIQIPEETPAVPAGEKLPPGQGR